jgi:hypothetical protein
MYGTILGIFFTVLSPIVSLTSLSNVPIANSKNIWTLLVGTFLRFLVNRKDIIAKAAIIIQLTTTVSLNLKFPKNQTHLA